MSLFNSTHDCTLCPLHKTTERVCIIPPYKKTEVMIIGEAPGANEERTGEFFSGKAGQLLTKLLDKAGIERSDVYITNAVHCRPPDNRTPTKKEINACKDWLDQEIARIKPKYILLLGNTPLISVLGEKGIRKLRGKPIIKEGVIYLPTYHPSYALRDPTQEPTLQADINTFKSLIDFKGLPKEQALNIRIVRNKEDLEEMCYDISGNSIVSFDLETTGLYSFTNEGQITSFGVGTHEYQWILPLHHRDSPWKNYDHKPLIKKVLKAASGAKMCAHNGKFDALWLFNKYRLLWKPDFDTMLAHFILDENSRHGLKLLANIFCGAPDWDIDKDQKAGAATLEDLARYHAHDLYYTRRLKFIFEKMLKKDASLHKVFHKLLMPVSSMFIDIELEGVLIDKNKFQEVEQILRKRIAESKAKMDKYAPDLNWASTKQVGELLFGKLGLNPLDKTAGGKNSTSESVLKRLADMHEIPREMMNFREANQQLSFFIEGWKPWLCDWRLHPTFKLSGTVTGRLSSDSPNLQQVPRDPFIRSLIVAPDGWELVESDLSQIELRIAAELAQEKNMLYAFQTGEDVHWKTAIREIYRGQGYVKEVIKTANLLGKKNLTYSGAIELMLKAGHEACIEVMPMWKEARKKAKAVGFGYLYGMWWKKFIIYARDNYGVKVTELEAQESRGAFFDLYPSFPDWHIKQKKFAKANGYVRSLTGRMRRLPAAARKPVGYDYDHEEALRQSINSPVQSFASDLNLMAALEMHSTFDPSYYRIIGTVHDSILQYVRKDKLKEVVPKIKKIMSHPKLMDDFGIRLSVPIEAEVSIGAWGASLAEKDYFKLV